MLTNATIDRIDRLSGADALGQAVVIEGAAISIRVLVDGVSNSARYTLGATIRDAEWTVFVSKQALEAAGETLPGVGDRLVVLMDGAAAGKLGVALAVKDRGLRQLSHYEVFLKPAP